MKTFKQFSEQAYESYELVEGPIDYLKSKIQSKVQSVKDYPSTLRSAASAFKSDPVGSLKAGGKSLTKTTAKSLMLDPIASRIKRATGNNPVANELIDYATFGVASTPWRQTAKTVVKQAPKLANTFARNLFVRGPQLGASAASAILGGSRLK